MRFRAELTAAGRSHPSWVEFHKLETAQDVFAAIDDLAATIAGRLDAEVERAEIGRALRRPVEPLGAYDCVFRAVPLIFEMTEDAFTRADRLLLAAQQADPHEPLVYSWRAFWHLFHIGEVWAKDLNAARAELDWVVRRALELDPKDAVALAVAGHIASFVHHDYGRALGLFDRSRRLDPTSAYCWDLSALTLCYTGDAPEGLRRLEASRGLWERHPTPYYHYCVTLATAARWRAGGRRSGSAAAGG
ncbi:MAG TPA: hypothetical protein VFG47_17880 [Geminicoccaceae bacterium]|nr:hypothetical protein [Geminicoccaceae bacterium]